MRVVGKLIAVAPIGEESMLSNREEVGSNHSRAGDRVPETHTEEWGGETKFGAVDPKGSSGGKSSSVKKKGVGGQGHGAHQSPGKNT